MKEIRVYAEGDPRLKEPLAKLFQRSRQATRPTPRFILCGSRRHAYDSYRDARTKYPDAVVMLLVDAEGPVHHPNDPWTHLANREGDQWPRPENASDDHCHLMIEAMESWLFADLSAVDEYFKYDRGGANEFHAKSRNADLISKPRANAELDRLALARFKKRYDKIAHGVALLLRVDPAKLRANSPSFHRLLDSIDAAST